MLNMFHIWLGAWRPLLLHPAPVRPHTHRLAGTEPAMPGTSLCRCVSPFSHPPKYDRDPSAKGAACLAGSFSYWNRCPIGTVFGYWNRCPTVKCTGENICQRKVTTLFPLVEEKQNKKSSARYVAQDF